MVGALAGGVVGEVLLDDAGSERDGSEGRDVAGRVVGEAEDDAWELRRELGEHPKVHESEVLDRTGVVRIALHEHDRDAGSREQGHRAVDIVHRRGTRRDDDWLAHRRDERQLLEPVHVAGAHLVGVDEWVEVRDRLDVVGR